MLRRLSASVRPSILLASVCFLTLPVAAQVRGAAPATPAGTLVLDQAGTCQPSWLPTFGGEPGVDGAIHALQVFDDGSGPALYAGGEFSSAGGVPASNIAKWSGTTWSALGSGLDGKVSALAVFDDGTGPALFAGGSFTGAGGVPASNIAKWDGSSWSPLGSGIGFGATWYGDSVEALAVFNDGSGRALYAAGYFALAGGSLALNIAKWDGSSWSALAVGPSSGTNGIIEALTAFDDGSGLALYVGGDFTDAGGVPANRIAKWDGSSWSALGSGMTKTVLALAAFDDGSGPSLYAAGMFPKAGGMVVDRIAKWDGATWSALDSGVGLWTYNQVDDLEVFDDGSGPALYAAGDFSTAGTAAANNVARWDGTTWSVLDTGTAGTVFALAIFDDGDGPALCAGGDFMFAGGVGTNRIAAWHGAAWAALGSGLNSSVVALAVFDDGTGPALHAAGYFIDAGGMPASRIAKWNGSAWSALGTGLNDAVFALAVFDDGSGSALYAAGYFNKTGDLLVKRIAKWDGTNWSALGSGIGGSSDAVSAMTIFDDGTGTALYVAGRFGSAGDVAAINIAKWDGATWSALGNGINGDFSSVSGLAVFDDGSGPALYAGGHFSTAGTVSASNIAKWDGTSWSALGSGIGASSFEYVHALTAFDDGTGPALFAGGNFTQAGGMPANNVAKWDGTNWSALGSGVDASVGALSVFDDGTGPALHVGGYFDEAGGGAAHHIAKWDGAAWSTLGNGLDGSVAALATFDDGTGSALAAGGYFDSAVDSGDSFLAKWAGCPVISPWTDLGYALAGATGAPLLVGTGKLTPGSAGSLALSNAAPSTLAFLFAASSSTPTPFQCGTLVPVPVEAEYLVITSPLGESVIPWSAFPAGLSGTSLYVQCAIHDPAALCGTSLSNALQADLP